MCSHEHRLQKIQEHFESISLEEFEDSIMQMLDEGDGEKSSLPEPAYIELRKKADKFLDKAICRKEFIKYLKNDLSISAEVSWRSHLGHVSVHIFREKEIYPPLNATQEIEEEYETFREIMDYFLEIKVIEMQLDEVLKRFINKQNSCENMEKIKHVAERVIKQQDFLYNQRTIIEKELLMLFGIFDFDFDLAWEEEDA